MSVGTVADIQRNGNVMPRTLLRNVCGLTRCCHDGVAADAPQIQQLPSAKDEWKVQCECNHLTDFGVLIYPQPEPTKSHVDMVPGISAMQLGWLTILIFSLVVALFYSTYGDKVFRGQQLSRKLNERSRQSLIVFNCLIVVTVLSHIAFVFGSSQSV